MPPPPGKKIEVPSAEGGRIKAEWVGYGVSLPSRLGGLRERRELPLWGPGQSFCDGGPLLAL